MSLWNRLSGLAKEPPPAFVFELSEAGLSYARRAQTPEIGFAPFSPGVLAVSPLRDNIQRPEELAEQVRKLAPANGGRKSRQAALILPDYAARVAVLDFDSFPAEAAEQLSLVRFRMKKAVPFDIDSAVIRFQSQTVSGNGKRYEVVTAAVAMEIVARYEAPFRAAGFQPGFVTLSSLATLDLLGDEAVSAAAKLSDRVLTVSVTEHGRLKLLRCVELPAQTPEEIMGVLFPTFAYIEDELKTRPKKLLVAGLGELAARWGAEWERELGAAIEPLRSRFGAPGGHNAGLLGYLEAEWRGA